MRPFFRVVKVFNKKVVRRTNPWEFGQGVGGRNGTKKHTAIVSVILDAIYDIYIISAENIL